MMHDVFISHSSKDHEAAKVICTALEAAGISCWMAPRNINPGQEWPDAIVKAVHNSRLMVLVFTDNANTSKDVAKEVALASNLHINVTPFKIEDGSPKGVLQYYLADKEWLSASNPPDGKQIKELIDVIKPLIESSKQEHPAVSEPQEETSESDLPEGEGIATEKEPPVKTESSYINYIREKKFIILPALGLLVIVLAWFSFGMEETISEEPAKAANVTAERYQSFVQLDNDDLYAFGRGQDGMLGLGNELNMLSPRKLQDLGNIKEVSAGNRHLLILLENGDVYSCGNNVYGQLGHGSRDDTINLKKIDGLPAIKAVSAGGNHSLVLADNGDLYSFGWGWDNQLGHGDKKQVVEVPRKVEGISNVVSISAGYRFSLALTENGNLYSFGKGEYGQLGHGDRLSQDVPKQVLAITGVKEISAGAYHSLILTEDGDVYSFGANWNGMLGHGDTEVRPLPTRISGIFNGLAISTGRSHSLILLQNGNAYSFGSGNDGVLGHGDEKDHYIPLLIEGLEDVTAISAGWHHSLALTEDGSVYAFGRGEDGRLGLGDTDSRFVPTLVDKTW